MWLIAPLLAAASPAYAADVCGGYPERMSTEEIEELRDRLNLIVPVRFAEAARKIQIVNVDLDDEHFAPAIEPLPGGQGYRVEVPARFRTLLCRLVALQLYYATRTITDPTIPPLLMQNCVRRGTDVSACLHEVSKGIQDYVGQKFPLDDFQADVSRLSESALNLILLHEYGHGVLGHLASPGAHDEEDADIFALLHGVGYGESTIVSLGIFVVLSFADPVLQDDAHQSFICRAKATSDYLATSADQVSLLISWSDGPDKFGPEREKRAKYPYEVPPGPLQSSLLTASSCRGGARADVLDFGKELNQMLALVGRIDQAAADRAQADLFGFYGPLAGFAIRTEMGRYVRASMMAQRFVGMHPLKNDAAKDPRYLQLLSDYLGGPDIPFMSSRDYGRLLTSKALAEMQIAFGAEKPDVAAIERIALDFRRALYFDPTFDAAYAALIGIEMLLGDCAEAERVIARGRLHTEREAKESFDTLETLLRKRRGTGGCHY